MNTDPAIDLPHLVICLALLAGSSLLGVMGTFTSGAVLSVYIGVATATGISVAGKVVGKVFTAGTRSGQHSQEG